LTQSAEVVRSDNDGELDIQKLKQACEQGN
jgi:hypothetical protein